MGDERTAYTTVYLYAPEGGEVVAELMPSKQVHIPRIGETIRVTDHTDEHQLEEGEYCVTDVETEYRLSDNIGRGTHWNQLVYIHTEEIDTDNETGDPDE